MDWYPYQMRLVSVQALLLRLVFMVGYMCDALQLYPMDTVLYMCLIQKPSILKIVSSALVST